MSDYVPQLQLQRVPGATHWIVHERCDLVAAHLQQFLVLKRYQKEPIAEFCAGLEGEEKFRAQAGLNACFRAAR